MTGQAYASLGQHPQAAAAFTKSLSADRTWSRTDEALLGLAASQIELKDANAARTQLQELTMKFTASPLVPRANYQLGQIALQGKKYSDATEHFKKIDLAKADSSLVAATRYGMGLAAFNSDDFASAKTALDVLLAGDAEAEVKNQATYLRGLTRKRLGDVSGASQDLAAYLSAASDVPGTNNARFTLALCQIEQKQFDEAKKTAVALLAVDAKFPRADQIYYELGHALAEQAGKEADAAASFTTLVEKFPESVYAAECWFRIGQTHEATAANESDEAKSKAAIEQAATSYAAGVAAGGQAELKEKLLFKLGEIRFRQQKYAESVSTLSKQLSEFPEGEFSGPACYFAAESHFQQDAFDEGMPLFQKVASAKFPPLEKAQLDNYKAKACYRSGQCAAKQNQWQESEKQFTTLVAQHPKFANVDDARYGIGLARHKQNQLSQAAEAYRAVLADGSGEPAAKAQFMLGEIQFAEKKYEDAVESFILVYSGYPYEEWKGMARFEAVRCLKELGNEERAIAALKEMIAAHPNHAKTKDAQALLKELEK